MKINKLLIGLNKLNFVLFLTLTFPVFAADHEGKFSSTVSSNADGIPNIERERKLDYYLVENFVCEYFNFLLKYHNKYCEFIDNFKTVHKTPSAMISIDFIHKFDELQLDPSTLLATLINIKKFSRKIPKHVEITQEDAEELFTVALMVTHKHESEVIWKNSDFAEISSINLKDLNKFERLFLQTLNYKFVIDHDEYQDLIRRFMEYMQDIVKSAAIKQANLTKKH